MTRGYIFVIIFTLVNSLVIAQNSLVDIPKLSSKFTLDIRYTTSTNIFEESLYYCAKCFLKPQVANHLIAANNYFITKGYRIIIYDCYRPFDVQRKMWEKIPRASYVADPNWGFYS